MKIKFTLLRPGHPPAALMATLDAGATVGDLAGYLDRADPARAADGQAYVTGTPGRDRPPTLSLVGPNVALAAERRIADSGLHSGATVTLTRSPESYPAAPGDVVSATIEVLSGRDAGQVFRVRGTSVTIGRDPSCDVQLSDRLVSRRHARLTIGRTTEVSDLNSANGIELNGSMVTRAPLRPGDILTVGDTQLTVQVNDATAASLGGGSVGFVRSPRLDPRYEGRKLTAPEPPHRPDPPRLPIIALLGPVVMGGLLYFITRSVTSLIFVALSPLMMIGYVAEGILAGKSAYKKALRVYRADVDALVSDARQAAADEVAARNREHPSLAECLDAVGHTTPLLWTRRPTDPGFAELRLGVGTQAARNSVDLPSDRNLPRDLMTELRQKVAPFATVDGVPVVAFAAEHGAIGVAGPRAALLDVARGLVTQAAALHSPAEMVLTAFASTQAARDWEWLTWLPHTTSAHSPLATRHLASTIESATALVSALEDLLASRAEKDAAPLPAVLVLVDDDTATEQVHSRLVELAERGRPAGLHVLWLAPETAKLPAACRNFVSLDARTGAGTAGFVHSGDLVAPVQVERLDADTALTLGRRLSCVVDIGARLDDDSDLPRAVSLMRVTEERMVASAAEILDRWQRAGSILTGPYAIPETRPTRKDAPLAAVIGRTANGAHRIDLRADGPHALVGGTTGSGKSELLQAWILALAGGYSPQRLTFLLIDYKGGAAFKELGDLPHTVGLVTDLDPHEVRRAFDSLGQELHKREVLFSRYGVKDLIELEKRRDVVEVPPSLVIIVDEFAALVNELPDFVDGMINIAQRGRSLGVHLILATQQPSGVIKGNLRANTNLRLALRTADESDSTDVLGSPQAAFFGLDTPGRAISKTGPGRLVTFQAGYAGGWTRDEPDPPEILVEELRFGPPLVWEPPEQDEVPVAPGPTDAQRLIDAINGAHREAGLGVPTRPWLPSLETVYNIAELHRRSTDRSDQRLVFGIWDLPRKQLQMPVAFEPDEAGNLAVYGTGASGKTTLLRTIAVAAGLANRDGPCHVYALDFGARGLASLDTLPHVGAVIQGTDHDRISRLLTWLGREVQQRADLFVGNGNAESISGYRAVTGDRLLSRILLMVDGFGAFRQEYEAGERARFFDLFSKIATEGRAVGVHVLLTADRPATVPSNLGSVVQTRVVLRLADANEYYGMNLPADVIKPNSPPGRGMLGGVELQVAVLGDAPDARSQARELEKLAASMRAGGVAEAPPISGLPAEVPLATLVESVGDEPVVGLSGAGESLEPITLNTEGSFLISGPAKSGRTSAMRAVAAALHRWRLDARLHLFTLSSRSALARSPYFATRAIGADKVEQRAKELVDELAGGAAAFTAIFLENVADLALLTDELVRVCRTQGIFVVADGDPAVLASTSAGALRPLKAARDGIALAPDPNEVNVVFGTQLGGRLNRADFPPGRALRVYAGRTTIVQIGWVPEE